MDSHSALGGYIAGAQARALPVSSLTNDYIHNRHRYAVWCETPEEAYHALV